MNVTLFKRPDMMKWQLHAVTLGLPARSRADQDDDVFPPRLGKLPHKRPPPRNLHVRQLVFQFPFAARFEHVYHLVLVLLVS